VKFSAASDQAVLVYLGEEIGPAAHQRVCHFLQVLQKHPPKWLRNIQPAYTSLMLTFDPCLTDHAEVEAAVRRFQARAEKMPHRKPRLIEIPVCYGGEFGPDLDDVADLCRLRKSEVIKLHTSQNYFAYFLGFVPGFAYLGDLPDSLATPRLDSPRKKVPRGSVGIAGRQTGVYPFATPGGWRLIGRTRLPIFQTKRKPMNAISVGDEVRFKPITQKEFRKLESA
jgi:inhibitor of KinA